MDPNLAIGVGSLIFTVIGSLAAVIAIRQSGTPTPVKISGAVDPKPALRLLRRGVQRTRASSAVQVLARFVFVSHSGRVVVGALDQFNISVFPDLFSACTHPRYRRRIAKLITVNIRDKTFHERPTHVAVPKEGNVLLAAEVARMLGLSLVVVRTLVPAIRFGDPVEGLITSGCCVLIVDDVASDGELLVRTVAALRAHGARISNCLCAVERLDGNSRESLAKYSVTLHAPIQIDERTLRELPCVKPPLAGGWVRPV
jgi:orotate phosphoribosyltransferase